MLIAQPMSTIFFLCREVIGPSECGVRGLLRPLAPPDTNRMADCVTATGEGSTLDGWSRLKEALWPPGASASISPWPSGGGGQRRVMPRPNAVIFCLSPPLLAPLLRLTNALGLEPSRQPVRQPPPSQTASVSMVTGIVRKKTFCWYVVMAQHTSRGGGYTRPPLGPRCCPYPNFLG